MSRGFWVMISSVLVVSRCSAHVPRSALQRGLTLRHIRERLLLHSSEIWPCFIATHNLCPALSVKADSPCVYADVSALRLYYRVQENPKVMSILLSSLLMDVDLFSIIVPYTMMRNPLVVGSFVLFK